MTDLDSLHLRSALALAEQAIGLSDPNPRVGCVLTSASGTVVLGQGHTQAAGQAHAEVMALRDAAQRGSDLRGGTAYVTLEPCSHHGRTPPCCDALVATGLARVVVALGDPNPAVNGQGVARLRAAGMQVEWATEEIAQAARELNIGFMARMERGRPWVRAKAACSLDGRTALVDGQSQWITGPEARADGHAWRKRAGAVLSGVGTVLADDPRLDVRLVATHLQPQRVIVDARLDTPPNAQIFSSGAAPLMVAAQPSPERVAALQARGAEVLCLPNGQGRVDLAALLTEMAQRGINELHVEAGAGLNGGLAQANLVDEWLVYMAPILMGPGRALAELPALSDLAQAQRWRYQDITPVGPDLRLRLRRL
ncbi:bifunctional diaminohydroxyphosphoribosylaminopyrimidine deaminase/5-amino-6-(5-phosphoribosylamino)uracil reductase RibD [Ideonella sp.]|jgi:diaminohydroxyphosphoribosylaminopyrimidine deaminase/5-amino-6-(5-phosphoribosylamino)uracil reductase|uniref:bifunctional diaminohydroxyphosphoribosylaminopyrimidine deaminase/5-amino-6-(5-phosphoribosylamino)uracil reductase RibD n=1 Tax=Ideonella sp. TaxID=1929293 RepID=UPI0037C1634B